MMSDYKEFKRGDTVRIISPRRDGISDSLLIDGKSEGVILDRIHDGSSFFTVQFKPNKWNVHSDNMVKVNNTTTTPVDVKFTPTDAHTFPSKATLSENPDRGKADVVNNPSHYTQGDVECKDAMISAFGREKYEIFCKLNAFKYIWRSDSKDNHDQDIDKAKWYMKQIKGNNND